MEEPNWAILVLIQDQYRNMIFLTNNGIVNEWMNEDYQVIKLDCTP